MSIKIIKRFIEPNKISYIREASELRIVESDSVEDAELLIDPNYDLIKTVFLPTKDQPAYLVRVGTVRGHYYRVADSSQIEPLIADRRKASLVVHAKLTKINYTQCANPTHQAKEKQTPGYRASIITSSVYDGSGNKVIGVSEAGEDWVDVISIGRGFSENTLHFQVVRPGNEEADTVLIGVTASEQEKLLERLQFCVENSLSMKCRLTGWTALPNLQVCSPEDFTLMKTAACAAHNIDIQPVRYRKNNDTHPVLTNIYISADDEEQPEEIVIEFVQETKKYRSLTRARTKRTDLLVDFAELSGRLAQPTGDEFYKVTFDFGEAPKSPVKCESTDSQVAARLYACPTEAIGCIGDTLHVTRYVATPDPKRVIVYDENTEEWVSLVDPSPRGGELLDYIKDHAQSDNPCYIQARNRIATLKTVTYASMDAFTATVTTEIHTLHQTGITRIHENADLRIERHTGNGNYDEVTSLVEEVIYIGAPKKTGLLLRVRDTSTNEVYFIKPYMIDHALLHAINRIVSLGSQGWEDLYYTFPRPKPHTADSETFLYVNPRDCVPKTTLLYIGSVLAACSNRAVSSRPSTLDHIDGAQFCEVSKVRRDGTVELINGQVITGTKAATAALIEKAKNAMGRSLWVVCIKKNDE